MSHEHHRAVAPQRVSALVVTLSDTRDAASDTGGALVHAALVAAGHDAQGPRIVREDPRTLRRELQRLLATPGIDAAIVTGGTGIAPRDLAFEVLDALYERVLPGFGELFRALSYAEIGSAAMLSRASAGVVGGRIVFSVPGRPAAARLALERLILPELGHLVGELRRDSPPEANP